MTMLSASATSSSVDIVLAALVLSSVTVSVLGRRKMIYLILKLKKTQFIQIYRVVQKTRNEVFVVTSAHLFDF